MKRFHVNGKGEPGECRAREGQCPFASDDNHFATKEAARKFYEDFQQNGTRFLAQNKGRVTAYHGSAHKFEEFDYDRLGANGAELGWGFYFADKEETVSAYAAGGYVYEVEFHPRNPLLVGENRLSRKDIEELVLMAEEENEFLYNNWGDTSGPERAQIVKQAVDAYSSGDDIENISSLINDTELTGKIYTHLYEKYGIDSLESNPHKMWKTGQVYVATHASSVTIKRVKEYSAE